MSKTAALMLVLVFIASSCINVTAPVGVSADSVEDSWVSKAPMQEARGGLSVAAVNGKIYAIGGSTRSGGGADMNGSIPVTGGIVDTNEEYDPVTDTWAFKESMPTPRERFAIATYKGKIYCIGGTTNHSKETGYTYTGVNEVYDPATDTWETKASMPTVRAWIQANVADGKIYLIGGYPNGTLNEVYDPETDTWTTETPMPTASHNYASAVVYNKIYIIYSDLNQIYGTETDAWSQGTSAPWDFGWGCAAATTGVNAPKRIYVMGECTSSNEGEPSYFVRVYDPEKDAWTFGSDIPTHRDLFGVAVVNDMLYAIGGLTSSYPDLPFKYPFSSTYDPTITPHATNEQYTPIGYGTPDPTPSPSPSPSPTSSPSSNQQPELTYATAATAATVTLIIITATAIALRKRHKLNAKPNP